MNILLDENIPAAADYFSGLGELRHMPGREIHAGDLADVEVLLVRSVTTVDRKLLQGTPVRFVGSCTTGVDHIDRDYLERAGIQFAHAPGANAQSVVEYVASALCTLGRRGRPLHTGMTVGIIGLGHIGSRLYRLLARMGFTCKGYDPLLPPKDEFDLVTRLEDVLQADIVTLHTPLSTTGRYPTWHLLDATQLASLPERCILLNTSRGAVLDNQALKRLLRQRPDLSVVLDVWEGEPNIDTQLLAMIDLATPHIAGYSVDGKLRGTAMVYQGLCRWLGREPRMPGQPPGQELTAQTWEDWQSLAAAIIDTYDIGADDARLREALGEGRNVAAAFERLRRNYPQRRELGLA